MLACLAGTGALAQPAKTAAPAAGASGTAKQWWETTGNPRGQWWLNHPNYQGAAADEIWARVEIPPSPLLTPEESLRTLRLAPGFRAEIVAAEPLIVRPVHMQFDSAGRLWVVEMPGYMRDIDGSGEQEPSGRVVVLEDTDGDGRMDKATPFLEGLVMPRTLSFVSGGVLVVEPPRIWYVQDLNGDLVADKKTLLVEGYGEAGNPEHSANGLMRAIDNWMYSAKSAVRYRWHQGALRAEPTLFRGQWGITQDDTGRLFYNYNPTPLHTEVVPAEYLIGPGGWDFSKQRNVVGRLPLSLALVEDKSVYPARVTPLVTLGASDLRPDGTLKKFTSASGPLIYRGDVLSQLRGKALVCDPVGNMVSCFTLDSEDPARPALRAYPDHEFLASTDERFRPVFLETGPDGALYVLDMHTAIVEHKRYVTEYLRNQVLTRNLGSFTATGRIYRIVPDKGGRRVPVNLAALAPAEWVRQLSSQNGWVRDTAQRLLVDRADASLLPALRQVVANGVEALGRLHALWTLEGLGGVDIATVKAALTDGDARVRTAGLRLSETMLTTRGETFAGAFQQLAEDSRVSVRRHLILALGKTDAEWAEKLLFRLAGEPGDEWQSSIAAAALRPRAAGFLQRAMADHSWKEPQSSRQRLLEQLGVSLIQDSDATRVGRFLALLAAQPRSDWRVRAVLGGAASVKPAGPAVRLPEEPPLFVDLRKSTDEEERRWSDALSLLVRWGKAPPAAAPLARLSPDEQKLHELGRTHYALICAACHLPNGQGIPAVAPPLAGSRWANGPAELAIKIVLHGITGPIEVNGESWNLTMPGFAGSTGILDDEKIAGILTYVRREWGNEASSVSPSQVRAIREANASRKEFWTAAELLPLLGAGQGRR